jgi:hypothetical protein
LAKSSCGGSSLLEQHEKIEKNPVDYTLKTKYRNGGNFYPFFSVLAIENLQNLSYLIDFFFFLFGEISSVKKRLI